MTPEQQRVIDECNMALQAVEVESTGYVSTREQDKIGGSQIPPKKDEK